MLRGGWRQGALSLFFKPELILVELLQLPDMAETGHVEEQPVKRSAAHFGSFSTFLFLG